MVLTFRALVLLYNKTAILYPNVLTLYFRPSSEPHFECIVCKLNNYVFCDLLNTGFYKLKN